MMVLYTTDVTNNNLYWAHSPYGIKQHWEFGEYM